MAGGKALDNLTGDSGDTSSDAGGYVNKVFLGTTPIVHDTTTPLRGGVIYKKPPTGGDITQSVAEAKKSFYSWDDKKLNKFINNLSSYGFKNVTRVSAQSLWDMSVDGASAWFAGSNGQRKVTPEQYLQWYSKGDDSKGPRLPQKQVYLYDNATIQNLIDDTLKNTLGRKASADENKQFYTAIRKMIDEGTVTTTKEQLVGGKKMSVSTTKPGFTQEAAQAKVESMIKGGTSSQKTDYLQKKSLDFGDFLSQLGG